MFFKKPQAPKYDFIWDNKVYTVQYPDNQFIFQYELLNDIIRAWINQEWALAVANQSVPINYHLVIQIAKINLHMLAHAEGMQYLEKVTRDGVYTKSFSRLMETISLIYISCDNVFLDVLKARFFKSHVDKVYGHRYGEEGIEALPTEEDWILCSKSYPWIWLLPHIKIAIAGDTRIQKEFIALHLQQSPT